MYRSSSTVSDLPIIVSFVSLHSIGVPDLQNTCTNNQLHYHASSGTLPNAAQFNPFTPNVKLHLLDRYHFTPEREKKQISDYCVSQLIHSPLVRHHSLVLWHLSPDSRLYALSPLTQCLTIHGWRSTSTSAILFSGSNTSSCDSSLVTNSSGVVFRLNLPS